jgi:hypothetical protein
MRPHVWRKAARMTRPMLEGSMQHMTIYESIEFSSARASGTLRAE